MIMYVLLCYPAFFGRIYYQQGVLFLVSNVVHVFVTHSTVQWKWEINIIIIIIFLLTKLQIESSLNMFNNQYKP